MLHSAHDAHVTRQDDRANYANKAAERLAQLMDQLDGVAPSDSRIGISIGSFESAGSVTDLQTGTDHVKDIYHVHSSLRSLSSLCS